MVDGGVMLPESWHYRDHTWFGISVRCFVANCEELQRVDSALSLVRGLRFYHRVK